MKIIKIHQQGYVLPVVLVLCMLVSSMLAYDLQNTIRQQRLNRMALLKQEMLSLMKVRLQQNVKPLLLHNNSIELTEMNFNLHLNKSSEAVIKMVFEPCNSDDICFQQMANTQYRIKILGQWKRYQNREEMSQWKRFVFVDMIDDHFVLRGFFPNEI